MRVSYPKKKMILHTARSISGTIRVPGDKSIAHRALLLGAVSRGKQVVDGVPRGSDLTSTVECLRQLGVFVERMPDGRMLVLSKPFDAGLRLNTGNSGTTARLLAGLLAGHDIEATIDGDDSLRRRPMQRIADPLSEMGARITTTDGRLPITVHGGNLQGITWTPPVASAQVKTAILFAGLCAKGKTVVVEPVATRDHTERMLRAMGVAIETDDGRVTLSGPAIPKATAIKVPGDMSSAAFLMAATTCLPDSEVYLPAVGVNATRSGFLKTMMTMGANIEVMNHDMYLDEPVADIVVKSGKARGVEVGPELVPGLIDELPVLAVVATQAEGTTTVSGAAELRHKESDRIEAIVSNLSALGASIEAREDGFVVQGPTPLKGATVDSYGDHRIAMAMAVAAFIADGTTKINDGGAIDISYPGFFQDLSTVLRSA